MNGRHAVVVVEDIGKYLNGTTHQAIDFSDQHAFQNSIRKRDNGQNSEKRNLAQSKRSAEHAQNTMKEHHKLINEPMITQSTNGKSESRRSRTKNAVEENEYTSIVGRCFRKTDMNDDTREQSKQKKDHRVVECLMCGFSSTSQGKTLETLMLQHLRVKHNVTKSLISSETAKRMQEWKDVLLKENPTRNPSTAWDYFVKQASGRNADCVLCDLTNFPRNDGSTFYMLKHLHMEHNFDQKWLPFKCWCTPRCK